MLRGISSCLHDGVTWSLLKTIATTSPAEGGLGFFGEVGRQYKAMFGVAPPQLMESLPEVTTAFIRCLLPRDHTLHMVFMNDASRRDLPVETIEAIGSLTGYKNRCERPVLCEVLERALNFFMSVKKHNRIYFTAYFR